MGRGPGEITRLLNRMGEGDTGAEGRLFDLVCRELRAEAHRQMRRQPEGHTLQTTALVHEAWLRLVRLTGSDWADRRHFLAVASRAMRSVLVDHAKARHRKKRDPGGRKLPLDVVTVAYEERSGDLLSLDAALTRLGEVDPDAVRVVELRFFGGLAMPEVARVIGCSQRTAERQWTFARAWLRKELA